MRPTSAFLSARSDKFRPVWGRHEVTYHRQCVFAGTTNERNYLKDHTGNRRFLPVPCGWIDLALARKIMDQLYAEALFEYRKGTLPMLSAAVEAVAERQQTRAGG